MEQMTAQEFAQKVTRDKQFRREVIDLCYNCDIPKDDKNGIFIMLNEGARKMGYDYDLEELAAEFNKQIKTLGIFKKFAFVGSMINMARKAKEAEQKAAAEVAEEPAKVEEAVEEAAEAVAEVVEAAEEAVEEVVETVEE